MDPVSVKRMAASGGLFQLKESATITVMPNTLKKSQRLKKVKRNR
jgi:hypothetical protein